MLSLTVPCVVNRVDLRWRRKPEELSELAALQVSTSSCCLLYDQLLTLILSALAMLCVYKPLGSVGPDVDYYV